MLPVNPYPARASGVPPSPRAGGSQGDTRWKAVDRETVLKLLQGVLAYICPKEEKKSRLCVQVLNPARPRTLDREGYRPGGRGTPPGRGGLGDLIHTRERIPAYHQEGFAVANPANSPRFPDLGIIIVNRYS